MTAMGMGAASGRPVEWMRRAALLAVGHQIAADDAAALEPRSGWPGCETDWQPLTHEAADLPLAPEAWAEAAAVAAERFPEAAAAFSILADNPGLHLPTPAVFARIAVAGLRLDYDTALAAALAAAGEPGGRLELAAPANLQLPAAQHGLRLSAAGLARVFRREARPRGERLVADHAPILAGEARAAMRILAGEGAVSLRSPSRRMARQLALDLAALLPGHACEILALRPGEAVPDPGESSVPLAVDLFDLDQEPRLPLDFGGGLVLLAPDRLETGRIRAVDAPPLAPPRARAVWEAAGVPAGLADRLAPRFALTLPELLAARQEALTLEALTETGMTGGGMAVGVPPDPGPSCRRPSVATGLEQAILAAGARRMGPFVTVVPTDVTLDDLVATPEMRGQLRDAVDWRRTDAQVWTGMGLPRAAGMAQGLSLLFSGPPGGGKTFAARCLAHALGLNLYRVDLSQVVSKYIGETEKRLARIFDEADAGHGVLFFDEADAVFGKRSEVKDAHDRYANIEVGFLLQRLETFAGVVVLATNLRANLDPAFTRRMQFIVEFPMPQKPERAELWRRHLPGPDWLDRQVDVEMLAERFRLAGGNIRNAAVAAAHLAAAEAAPVGPRHLARALVRELEKSGLPRGAEDLGPLALWIDEGAAP